MFELPDKWSIKVTDKNRKLINDWKITTEYDDDLFRFKHYEYVNYDGAGVFEVEYPEISLDHFKEYVLDKTPKKQKSVKEDTSYLINFLKQNNIT